jgi:hypothetical protein
MIWKRALLFLIWVYIKCEINISAIFWIVIKINQLSELCMCKRLTYSYIPRDIICRLRQIFRSRLLTTVIYHSNNCFGVIWADHRVFMNTLINFVMFWGREPNLFSGVLLICCIFCLAPIYYLLLIQKLYWALQTIEHCEKKINSCHFIKPTIS